jgi:hypothetical protein
VLIQDGLTLFWLNSFTDKQDSAGSEILVEVAILERRENALY